MEIKLPSINTDQDIERKARRFQIYHNKDLIKMVHKFQNFQKKFKKQVDQIQKSKNSIKVKQIPSIDITKSKSRSKLQYNKWYIKPTERYKNRYNFFESKQGKYSNPEHLYNQLGKTSRLKDQINPKVITDLKKKIAENGRVPICLQEL